MPPFLLSSPLPTLLLVAVPLEEFTRCANQLFYEADISISLPFLFHFNPIPILGRDLLKSSMSTLFFQNPSRFLPPTPFPFPNTTPWDPIKFSQPSAIPTISNMSYIERGIEDSDESEKVFCCCLQNKQNISIHPWHKNHNTLIFHR